MSASSGDTPTLTANPVRRKQERSPAARSPAKLDGGILTDAVTRLSRSFRVLNSESRGQRAAIDALMGVRSKTVYRIDDMTEELGAIPVTKESFRSAAAATSNRAGHASAAEADADPSPGPRSCSTSSPA